MGAKLMSEIIQKLDYCILCKKYSIIVGKYDNTFWIPSQKCEGVCCCFICDILLSVIFLF